MKKGLLVVLVLIMCLVMVGCNKKEEVLTGGWETVLSSKVNDINEEDLYNFNNAVKAYGKENLEAVALLGKQVVAGTNYMFLAKSDSKYKIVIVYADLEGVSKVSSVTDFNYVDYVNKNSDGISEQLSGGWYTESANTEYKLEDEKVESLFESATSTLAGMEFKPLLVVGKQLVAGTNYALVCYGQATVPNATTGIYLMTLYAKLDGTSEITGIAYIDLSQYNQ